VYGLANCDQNVLEPLLVAKRIPEAVELTLGHGLAGEGSEKEPETVYVQAVGARLGV